MATGHWAFGEPGDSLPMVTLCLFIKCPGSAAQDLVPAFVKLRLPEGAPLCHSQHQSNSWPLRPPSRPPQPSPRAPWRRHKDTPKLAELPLKGTGCTRATSTPRDARGAVHATRALSSAAPQPASRTRTHQSCRLPASCTDHQPARSPDTPIPHPGAGSERPRRGGQGLRDTATAQQAGEAGRPGSGGS